MAFWISINPLRAYRDSIKREWRPIMTYHTDGGWRCYRADTGKIGYGSSAREAWHDFWNKVFN